MKELEGVFQTIVYYLKRLLHLQLIILQKQMKSINQIYQEQWE